jgi:hypothetical protein
MRNLAKLFGSNDNIRTDHLKCDSCRTRVHLKRIEQFEGVERRLFECAHCGSTKALRIDMPTAVSRVVDGAIVFDAPYV